MAQVAKGAGARLGRAGGVKGGEGVRVRWKVERVGGVPGEEEEAAEEDGWEDEGADEVAGAGRGLGRKHGDVDLDTGGNK